MTKPLKIAVLELLSDTLDGSSRFAIYQRLMQRQYYSIMPQSVAAWCRRLGHDVDYRTFYGQSDVEELIAADIDVLFVSAYTETSLAAYAVAALTARRSARARTVIGGPHAKSFPEDCLQFYDVVVKSCNRDTIADILNGHFDRGAIVEQPTRLDEIPSVEERMADIATASFGGAGPSPVSVFPLLASIGCPYACDFCVDWNQHYVTRNTSDLARDLAYINRRFPRAVVAFHDPNFAVKFDRTMDVLDEVRQDRNNPYVTESSLSVLKTDRLERLQRSNCIHIAPGIESWSAYSNKSGTTGLAAGDKYAKIIGHLRLIKSYVPGVQANFVFGTDADNGRQPIVLTTRFIRNLPGIWPGLSIPTPYGGTPLFDHLRSTGRLLPNLPSCLYAWPNLVFRLKHYDPADFYRAHATFERLASSPPTMARRFAADGHVSVRLANLARGIKSRGNARLLRRLCAEYETDGDLRRFYDGRRSVIPAAYERQYARKLGRYRHLMPDLSALRPVV